MISKGKCSRIIHNFTMDVDPGYKYTEKFRGGVEYYMVESKDIISSICFKIKKNENNQLVSFKGQSITFRLSINQRNLELNNCTYNQLLTYKSVKVCCIFTPIQILTFIIIV